MVLAPTWTTAVYTAADYDGVTRIDFQMFLGLPSVLSTSAGSSKPRTSGTLLHLHCPLPSCQGPLCNMTDEHTTVVHQLRLCSATAEAMECVGGLADCKLVFEDGSRCEVSKGLIAAHSRVLGCVSQHIAQHVVSTASTLHSITACVAKG